MSLKLLFDPATGRVLGAQAVGAEGVDKRIDVLAVAIRAGLTVEDLEELELSYAPPYGSAKDPINYAGFVASNVRSGDQPVCHTEDVAHRGRTRCCWTCGRPPRSPPGRSPAPSTSPWTTCATAWANCRATRRSWRSARWACAATWPAASWRRTGSAAAT